MTNTPRYLDDDPVPSRQPSSSGHGSDEFLDNPLPLARVEDEPTACRDFLASLQGGSQPLLNNPLPAAAPPRQSSTEQQWRTKRYRLPRDIAGVLRMLRPLGFLAPLHQDAQGLVALSQIHAAETELKLGLDEKRYDSKPEALRAAQALYNDLRMVRRNPGRYAAEQSGGHDATHYSAAARKRSLG